MTKLSDKQKSFHNSETKTCKINNKRYLGNKYKLLDFIKSIVKQECDGINIVADIFAGTGVVSSAFIDKKLIINDILYSNYICYIAWFDSQKYDKNKVEKYIKHYNALHIKTDNYMSDNFANTFFDQDTCRKIGYIREDIENNFQNKKINKKEWALLITSLLYSMDRIANTCGHYDAYRRDGTFDKELELLLPAPEENLQDNQLFHMDANMLVREIKADLVYIDPPYNSRQYCDIYHLLENIALWQKPEVFGIGRKMDRTKLKSDYCTVDAPKAFEDLIKNINAKYILLSYNNMETKGDNRSNARITDGDILRILKTKGEVRVFSKKYKAFTTGKSNIKGNEERLFLCICKQISKHPIQSPLNYVGGKFKLLPQILPKFPVNIKNFVDLFCGGCNVGINISAEKIIFNDTNENLINIYKVFQNIEKTKIITTIDQIIARFELSQSAINGYDFYLCRNKDGLQKYNKDGYIKLRDVFNKMTIKNNDYYLMLYVLIIFSFNNQIRFNAKGQFNLPVGKRDFNSKMRIKLSHFIDRIQKNNCEFTNLDFRKISPKAFGKDTFVYIDPPYLITCATYNEKNGWREQDEHDLLDYIHMLNTQGVRFGLSNVLTNKGKVNTTLMNWINKNNYRVINLDYSYANSNYQTKDKTSKPQEVLIVNY
ncbi:Dam family site-specific DNA-(adenine-N6)-methyltransferase [Helicobacter sp. 11S03491-1]|uniref:Dam family site-specific DNA-(adenine-N6)-methyltransferase n=1 Tax=Helicobacter sp. 11S03491-1 TaxID=1476196 RepID=UPI000BA57A36|nr:Dam family site-specific DNA-(adenine-N6)-methyltransferase [Helicobacter sp. 11S03491-1]PAF42226.1 DNA adenine methylase [Helicobacter sp. 11S03491-1]